MEKATLDTQVSTGEVRLHLALELSKRTWVLGFSDGKGLRIVELASECWGGLGVEIARAKKRFGLPEETPVVSCYEAGQDGFWIHRLLESLGVTNVVVEPASIEVDRRARRRKTDRVDVKKLLSLLVRYAAGERGVWRVARVPSPEEEDARRPHRERERLVKERTAHRARIKSLLALHGSKLAAGRRFLERLDQVRCWDGHPLPEHLKQELLREHRRLTWVQEQIAEIEREQSERAAVGQTTFDRKVRHLVSLRGVGVRGASVLVAEFFGWRQFRNRRQVGALAGMAGTPYRSGEMDRDQGIDRAGNRRIRTLMVELAWGWLRWQPQSARAKWYRQRTGPGRRMRRIMIVALARQLLVDLWHFVEHGVVPKDAVLSTP
ncbi:MAG: IS110 family RNA-guided transposase [Planctomycetota bacterium]